MPPTLATIVCMLFIFYLFWMDLRRPDGRSKALWVPLTWMFLAGSRWVSSWLNAAPSFASANDYADGSPIDRAAFFALIVAGVFILARRNIDWERLLIKNKWIVLYLLYCLASIAWTDEPFLLMKRWIKDLGNPIMALVILTERRPYEAVGVVLRRLAFLLLPLSVLFIKYYPELGRAYHNDGSPMFTGAGHQKNDLGLMCLMAGIYLFWELLQKRKARAEFTRQEKLVAIVLTSMLAWLLHMSDSQTSFVCLVVAVAVLLLARTPFVAGRPSRIIGVLLFTAVSIWLLNEVTHVRELAFNFLGRDPTLTNRTEIWQTLAGFEVNPIVGTGFMSFWQGARMEKVWTLLNSRGLNQAHNGYLEQYLNLGYIGVTFIVVLMLSGLLKVRRHLSIDPAAGMLRLCFIVTAILYNLTEASFYGMNNMWMLLLLGCIEIPRQQRTRAANNIPLKQVMAQSKAGVEYQRSPPRVQAERRQRSGLGGRTPGGLDAHSSPSSRHGHRPADFR